LLDPADQPHRSRSLLGSLHRHRQRDDGVDLRFVVGLVEPPAATAGNLFGDGSGDMTVKVGEAAMPRRPSTMAACRSITTTGYWGCLLSSLPG
jgi:hypothetical protein